MKALCCLILPALIGFITPGIVAADPEVDFQDLDKIRVDALTYLKKIPDLDKSVRITIGNIDPHLKLPICSHLEFSLPSHSNYRGHFRLGVRCVEPNEWSLFLSVTILAPNTYYTTRTELDKNHPIQKEDIIATEIYQANNPQGGINDPQQLMGRTLTHPLRAGATVRNTDLHPEPSLARGQTVQIVGVGPGFKITRTGQLLTNASPGQLTQVKTTSKQIITGIARSGGTVEIKLQ